ncbi:hypothetical protein AURDEDRAFT_178661 [Auricularia subglabra TFB-10046 SS5]|uniref:Uncharacterized protein n=1 Tax=Auricularia subglabra (strain TFB-10046 / SS5) TaxID=717982 RepID=J0CQ01_AURST|nr:hypothetical protein AURDEDRAFT_178661 [Auricularia subglabra TFB-10046 SS5]
MRATRQGLREAAKEQAAREALEKKAREIARQATRPMTRSARKSGAQAVTAETTPPPAAEEDAASTDGEGDAAHEGSVRIERRCLACTAVAKKDVPWHYWKNCPVSASAGIQTFR